MALANEIFFILVLYRLSSIWAQFLTRSGWVWMFKSGDGSVACTLHPPELYAATLVNAYDPSPQMHLSKFQEVWHRACSIQSIFKIKHQTLKSYIIYQHYVISGGTRSASWSRESSCLAKCRLCAGWGPGVSLLYCWRLCVVVKGVGSSIVHLPSTEKSFVAALFFLWNKYFIYLILMSSVLKGSKFQQRLNRWITAFPLWKTHLNWID